MAGGGDTLFNNLAAPQAARGAGSMLSRNTQPTASPRRLPQVRLCFDGQPGSVPVREGARIESGLDLPGTPVFPQVI